MATAVGEGSMAAGVSVGNEGTGVLVTVGTGEELVGDVVGVEVGELVGVIVGWGSRGGAPSGGSPPSRDWIR